MPVSAKFRPLPAPLMPRLFGWMMFFAYAASATAVTAAMPEANRAASAAGKGWADQA